jgi:hypothetical protein
MDLGGLIGRETERAAVRAAATGEDGRRCLGRGTGHARPRRLGFTR